MTEGATWIFRSLPPRSTAPACGSTTCSSTPVSCRRSKRSTICAAACRNVYEYYNAVDSYKSGCAALTVCDELEGLGAALHDINAGATKAVDATTLQSYDGMETHQFYDLEEYALALTADDARGQAFVQQMERCFPPEGRFHTEQFFSVYNNRMNDIRYYSGVTTYAPAETYRNEWQQTAWYAATKR